jgi:hypothetical protein
VVTGREWETERAQQQQLCTGLLLDQKLGEERQSLAVNHIDPLVWECNGPIEMIDPPCCDLPWYDQGVARVIRNRVGFKACRAFGMVSTTCSGGCARGSKKSRRD